MAARHHHHAGTTTTAPAAPVPTVRRGAGTLPTVPSEPPTTLNIDEATADLAEGVWTITADVSEIGETEAIELLRRAIAACDNHTSGRVQWWVEPASGRSDRIAQGAGLTTDRDILQLRRDLPLDSHATITTTGAA